MITELSSLDLYYLNKEFQILNNAKIDKAFQDKTTFVFQLHIPKIGKKYLRITLPSLIYMSDYKESFEDSGKFGLNIRKHIRNSRIREIKQLEFERILKIKLQTNQKILFLYIELFKPGNVILTSEENKIIMASTYKGFGSRLIRPGGMYEYPKREYNFLVLKEKDLVKLLESSDKSSIVITLATQLGLGGKYAEEILKNANVEKNKLKLDNKEIKRLFEAIKDLRTSKKELNNDLDKHYTIKSKADKIEQHDSKYEKKKSQLQGIVRQQQAMIKGLEKAVIENQKKAELIYEKYQVIENLRDQLKKLAEIAMS